MARYTVWHKKPNSRKWNREIFDQSSPDADILKSVAASVKENYPDWDVVIADASHPPTNSVPWTHRRKGK